MGYLFKQSDSSSDNYNANMIRWLIIRFISTYYSIYCIVLALVLFLRSTTKCSEFTSIYYFYVIHSSSITTLSWSWSQWTWSLFLEHWVRRQGGRRPTGEQSFTGHQVGTHTTLHTFTLRMVKKLINFVSYSISSYIDGIITHAFYYCMWLL